MRPEHTPSGDPCSKCGMAARRHRKRARARTGYWRERGRQRRQEARTEALRIIGVDGEGWTTPDGRHLYTYLAACDEAGLVSELEDAEGLKAQAVLDWLLALPPGLVVGYSLGYDRTKWLESAPDHTVYMVEHPEKRKGSFAPRPVRWLDYRINLVATKFTVSRMLDGTESRGLRKGKQRRIRKRHSRVVWDLFRFFQSSFVKALRKWSVGHKAQVDRIERMKARRGSFKGIGKAEKAYCQEECVLLAQLARELIEAHEQVGNPLKDFYGPGSGAKIILKRCNAEAQRSRVPPDMVDPVKCAFFGGRFEVSQIGLFEESLYQRDISGAYPYAFCLLPCMACGHWERVKGARLEDAIANDEGLTCVSYRIDPHGEACPAWGPLPHRLPNGDIVFPLRSAGGWAWNREFRLARVLHPGVRALEGWTWVQDCDHPHPFREEFATGYIRRLGLGKTARGLALRLDYNSAYGKSAQGVGSKRFRCLVRAGWITSYCRSMALEGILAAEDPWDVLEVATDSILSRVPLDLPEPFDLGTGDAVDEHGKPTHKPLGSWDKKKGFEGGAFIVRPGMRFALAAADEDLENTAARGVGIKTLHSNRKKILRSWEAEPMRPVEVQQPAMFHGARSQVRRLKDWTYKRNVQKYGTWQDPEPRVLSFSAMPKRYGIEQSPTTETAIALSPWWLPQSADARSVPYSKLRGKRSRLLDELEQREDQERAQPEYGQLRIV